MESPWPEKLSIARKKAIEELLRGRKFTDQLQMVFHKPLRDHGSVSAEDLVEKILRSFTEALLILNSGEAGEVCQDPATAHVGSPCCDDRRSEDSGESRKTPGPNDRRKSYKRRKTSQTSTKVTPTPIDDGYAWRKYGQKEILNAKHPRCYYRCTHRNDQGCQATKQVQRTEDDPSMYQTTYMGHHTCKAILKAPQFAMDSTHPTESYILSFGSNTPTKQEHPFFSFSSIKKENREENRSNLSHNHSPSLYLRSPEPATFETSGLKTVMPSTPGSDHGEVVSGVCSCTTSSQSLDIDFMGSFDIDDVFQFDEEELFQGFL